MLLQDVYLLVFDTRLMLINILDVITTGFCQEYMFKHVLLYFRDSVHNSIVVSGNYWIHDCSLRYFNPSAHLKA